jgi:hypothetical protein
MIVYKFVIFQSTRVLYKKYMPRVLLTALTIYSRCIDRLSMMSIDIMLYHD